MQELDLKALERQAWRSTFEDGLWDVFFGMMMAGMGLEVFLPLEWVYYVLLFVAVALFAGLKRFVTIPRIGRVKFGRERRVKKGLVAGILAASALIGLAVAVVRGLSIGPAWLHEPYTLGVVALIVFTSVFAAMAHWMDHRRFYLIGAVFAGGFGEMVFWRTGWVFAIGGGVVLILGLVSLVRFIHKYPVGDGVPADGQ